MSPYLALELRTQEQVIAARGTTTHILRQRHEHSFILFNVTGDHDVGVAHLVRQYKNDWTELCDDWMFFEFDNNQVQLRFDSVEDYAAYYNRHAPHNLPLEIIYRD